MSINVFIFMFIDERTEELKEAIAKHTKNAHIVVDRYHVITEEQAGELGE